MHSRPRRHTHSLSSVSSSCLLLSGRDRSFFIHGFLSFTHIFHKNDALAGRRSVLLCRLWLSLVNCPAPHSPDVELCDEDSSAVPSPAPSPCPPEPDQNPSDTSTCPSPLPQTVPRLTVTRPAANAPPSTDAAPTPDVVAPSSTLSPSDAAVSSLRSSSTAFVKVATRPRRIHAPVRKRLQSNPSFLFLVDARSLRSVCPLSRVCAFYS